MSLESSRLLKEFLTVYFQIAREYNSCTVIANLPHLTSTSALFTEPALNTTDPLSSPKPLLNSIDFVRRTYIDYIMPLLPPHATQKCHELSNPFTPQEHMAADPSVLDPENFPTLDMEKFSDAVSRNMLICMAITEPDKGALVIGGRFAFGEQVVEIAGEYLVSSDTNES